MATTLRKIISDENAIDKVQKLQATNVFKAPLDKFAKRHALGELGNKANIPNSGSLLNKVKEATCYENLKNTKAKVDSYWKNNDGRKLIRTESLKQINKNTVIATDANIAGSTNKIILRSASNIKVNPTAVAKQPIREIKPATTAKATAKPAVKKENSQKSTATKKEVHILRREESNLSRRSLTKLKSVLAKDAAKRDAIVATKTENGTILRQKNIKTQVCQVESNPIKAKANLKPVEKVKVKENFLQKPANVEFKYRIEDIDANDDDNIFALSEYVNDIYKYLNQLEEEFKIEEDFMKNQVEVTPRMRTVLLDWINEVAHQFRLISETYQITVGIIDRYLQIVPTTTRGHLQLVGVTALFIATKYEELFTSDISDFIYMTDNSYTKVEIIEMEKKIMRALDFQLCRPFPLQFLRRFSKAISADQLEHMLAKYILELSSIEYTLAHYKPSEMAAAALFLSVSLLNLKRNPRDKIWNKTVEHYSGYSSTQLEPLVKKIAFFLKNAPKSKNRSIYSKYKHEKYSRISTRPELYGGVIDSIIGSTD